MQNEHKLDRLPFATLSAEQLAQLKKTEVELNQAGNDVYLIAFQKEAEARSQ